MKVLKKKLVSSSFRFVNYSSLVLRKDDTDVVEGAGESAVNWRNETWVKSRDGIQCLKDANVDTEKILDCRKNLHLHSDGATVATFNVFIGTGLVALLLARVW